MEKFKIKKYLSLVLVGLMLYGANLQNVSAQKRTDDALEKIKTDAYRLGIGKKSTVVVKLNPANILWAAFVRSAAGHFKFTTH